MVKARTVELRGHNYWVIKGRAGAALVSSRTEAGAFHVVDADGRCDCRGFNYRGTCSHIEALRTLNERQAAAIAAVMGLYDGPTAA